MPGALSGYRILEFGDHPTVAVLGMLLADQGADVVKVESPEGDPLRGTPVFSVWNRGKKSVSVGCGETELIRGLVRGSDAIIEAFHSGRNSYGIDGEFAHDIRPDIVYLTLPGFGEEHPQADTPGTEILISAATGVYVDRSPDGTEGSSFIALPYASIFGAMVAAPALAAALYHRERTGEGQGVTVPLYDAMFTAMGSSVVRRPDVAAEPAAISPAIARFYRCQDGRWINLNATYERSLRPILDVLGHPEWFGPLTDDRLHQNLEEREEWAVRFAEPWLQRSALEWESLMAEAGVPLTMCRTLQEWMDTEHARVSGAVMDIEDHEFGPMRQVGIQVRMSHSPGEVRAPAPLLGQDNETILAET